MGSIVIGLATGFILSLLLVIVNFSQLSGLPLLNFPIPFRFGLKFDWGTFVSFAVIYVAFTLEVIGDIAATSMVTGEPVKGALFMRRLKGGILEMGLILCYLILPTPAPTLSEKDSAVH